MTDLFLADRITQLATDLVDQATLVIDTSEEVECGSTEVTIADQEQRARYLQATCRDFDRLVRNHEHRLTTVEMDALRKFSGQCGAVAVRVLRFTKPLAPSMEKRWRIEHITMPTTLCELRADVVKIARRLSETAEPAAPRGPQENASWREELEELLAGAFSQDELRRVLQLRATHVLSPDQLPERVSLVEVVHQLVDRAVRLGRIDALFDMLAAERPSRAGEIEAVKRKWRAW